MACFNCNNKKMQDIEYVRKLARALSLIEKSNVVIYSRYERGFGDVYKFEVETSQNRQTAIEIIKFEIQPIQPIENLQLQHDAVGVVLSDIGDTGLSTITAKETEEIKPKKSGRSRKQVL
jgi:hypothetical protein